MSSFFAIKLDICDTCADTGAMSKRAAPAAPRRIAKMIRERVERGGERLWRLEDFDGLPPTAVAQALSRLTRQGIIERLSKGTYYRSRQTTFGKSRPNPEAIQELVSRRRNIFPSGIAAASLLGFSTQTARRGEVSTSSLSLPRKLIGSETVIHTRRPEAWAGLSHADAALLDFLKRGGRTSELSPEETVRKSLALISERGRLQRLLKIADSEPPRVRALLGAIAEEIGKNTTACARLRASLNRLSRFDFGLFAGLSHAKKWQAKGQS
jgi:DNA-binding transcriptional ArsR family regulator